jgi:hypothetical protein
MNHFGLILHTSYLNLQKHKHFNKFILKKEKLSHNNMLTFNQHNIVLIT